MSEVSFLNDSGEVCYVTQQQIIDAASKYQRGVLYYAGKNIKTYVAPGKIFKSIDSLGVKSEEDFWQFINSAQRSGAGFPSSFGSVFRKLYKFPRVPEITKKAFEKYVRGGWQEAIKKGVIDEKIYQYDINSAYRSATMDGLPDFSSLHLGLQHNGKMVFGFRRGRSAACDGLYFQDGRPDSVECNQDFTVSFSKTVDLTPVWDKIDTHFRRDHVKKIARSFWGSWISRRNLKCVSVGSGKSWYLPNIYFNPVWSLCITERIRQRLQAYNPYHVYVDSIIIPYQIPVGNGIGEWKLTGEFEPKTEIVGAGAIINKGKWIKHAGVRHEHISVLKM